MRPLEPWAHEASLIQHCTIYSETLTNLWRRLRYATAAVAHTLEFDLCVDEKRTNDRRQPLNKHALWDLFGSHDTTCMWCLDRKSIRWQLIERDSFYLNDLQTTFRFDRVKIEILSPLFDFVSLASSRLHRVIARLSLQHSDVVRKAIWFPYIHDPPWCRMLH